MQLHGKMLLCILVFAPPITLLILSAFAPSLIPYLLQRSDNFTPTGAVQTLWLIVAALLVFMMQIGFLMLESAGTEPKNAQGVAIKNFLNFIASWLGFALVGFGLMFGASLIGLFGSTRFLWSNLSPYELALLLYQAGFAAVTATIVSSGIVERSRIAANVLTSLFIALTIFPLFGHWAWNPWGSVPAEAGFSGGGWLKALGFNDFAGSAVVHCIGAFAGLAGVIVLGPRRTPNLAFRGNLPMSTLGVLFLWIGWVGFNGGSVRLIDEIGRVIVNTNIAGIAAGLTGWLYLQIRGKRHDANRILVGAMGGLVAITAGSLSFEWWMALLVGMVAGPAAIEIAICFSEGILNPDLNGNDPETKIPRLGVTHFITGLFGFLLSLEFFQLYLFSHSTSLTFSYIAAFVTGFLGFKASQVLWSRLHRLKIDDPVDGISVHGIGGIIGTLAVGVFDSQSNLSIQCLGVLVAAVWAFGLAFLFFNQLNRLGIFRVTPEEEDKGVGLKGLGFEMIMFWADYGKLADIAEQEKHLSERIQKQQRQLLNQMNNISHQVISPIRGVIQAFRAVFPKGIINPPAEFTTRDLKKLASAEKFSRLALHHMTNMRLFGLLEEDDPNEALKKIHSLRHFSLNTVVRDIVELLEVVAEFRGIKVDFREPLSDINIRSDESLVRHAITNLIENAINYSHDSGHVEVLLEEPVRTSARSAPGMARLHIINKGLPIEDDDRERIFDRSHRGKDAATKRPDGTGIGLYIVKQIMKLQGGLVELLPQESDPEITHFAAEFKL